MPSVDELFSQRGEVAALMRSKDWRETPLGPPETWPPSLRTVLRLMLSSRYAMWLGWGPDLLFFYNDAYREQTLGQKHPWALGRPTREVWAEIWNQLKPRIHHVMRRGEATWDSGLLLFLERNGYAEETFHTFSYSPASDDHGTTQGLFCVVIEETERVLGERRMALLREFASELSRANSTAEVLDAMERCLTKEARDIPFSLTYLFDEAGSSAQLISRTAIDAGDPAAAERIQIQEAAPWPFHTLVSELRPVQVPLSAERRWPAGPWKQPPVEALVLPIPQAGQARPAGVFVAAASPHRRLDDAYRSFLELFVGQLAAGLDNARAYESERQRAEALAQIDRAKTAFFSNVSHEFRTPLTLMLGPTEDALASPQRALTGRDLEVVHRNELRLLKLVNALLDFSRIEAGRAEATYEAVDLAALTRELASAFESAMQRGGLHYDVRCTSLSGPVYVDPDMWEKIVLNLLSNALKFTLQGSVRLLLSEHEDAVELRVEDSGPGIAADELPRMFERFHRIEGTPARTHEGSGIGLALVRDLVSLHGGDIRVESELGRGTTFVVRMKKGAQHLPAEKIQTRSRKRTGLRAESYLAEAMRWVPTEEAPATAREAHGGQRVQQAKAARVLVADDNNDMREYVARLLREHWTVEAVTDGQAALEHAKAHAPDLIVSDVMMPRLDGFGLVRQIRADPQLRTIPVILLSARAGEDETGAGLEAGANDYVVKPFAARELLARVAAQLAIAKIRKEAEAQKEAQRRVVESLFMNAPAGIALVRGDEQVIDFANPMALDIWGKTADVIGRPLLEALPELRGKGFDELMRQVVRTGEPFIGDEVPIVFHRQGLEEKLFLKFVYVPVQNDGGVVDGVAAFGFDVTTQVLARQRETLAATIGRVFVSNDPLSDQLRHCMGALVECGAVQARIWTHNQAHDVLELRASAGLETNDESLVASIAVGEHIWGRAAHTRRPQWLPVAEEPSLANNALVVASSCTRVGVYPLCVGDRLMGVMSVLASDDTARRGLDSLAAIADQIALGIDRDSGERFRELFIGMLGHDLRNPLNAVNMAAHLLASGQLTSQQLRTVERIRGSAGRMKRMIGQVLDFTRARSGGGIPIVRSPSDIHAICAQTIEEIATVHPERAINADYSGDGRGLWDGDRLAQVFSNLVGNAVTHGATDAPIQVSVHSTEEMVLISIANQGPPIPQALMPALFDPFRRAAHGKGAGTQGLGLGLFITQQIVLAHGGTITVESNEAQGTRFTCRLPRLMEEQHELAAV